MRDNTGKLEKISATKELRTLRIEAKRLADIYSLVQDQLNRLKVEELTLQNIVVQESVNSVNNAEGSCTDPTKNQDLVHEVNKTDLDLSVIPSSSNMQDAGQFSNDTSWEEEDEDSSNECVLNL